MLSWSRKTNLYLQEDLDKKWNPDISDTSTNFGSLPTVADHLAGCTKSRQGQIAKLSYGEQIQKW